MAGSVLRKYWSHPSFNAQTFADLNEEASKYFASIMLEVGGEGAGSIEDDKRKR